MAQAGAAQVVLPGAAWQGVARLGTWGDHLTLQAAADAFRVKLCLLTSYRDSFVVEVAPRE